MACVKNGAVVNATAVSLIKYEGKGKCKVTPLEVRLWPRGREEV
jgi:hypothetical protein